MDDPRSTIRARTEQAEMPQKKTRAGGRVTEALSGRAEGDLSLTVNGGQIGTAGIDRDLLVHLDGLARRLRYIVGRLQRAADSIEAVVGEDRKSTRLNSSH